MHFSSRKAVVAIVATFALVPPAIDAATPTAVNVPPPKLITTTALKAISATPPPVKNVTTAALTVIAASKFKIVSPTRSTAPIARGGN